MVESIANPPVAVLWHAILVGGSVVDSRLAKSGIGACQTFKSALASQRIIWMTTPFADAHTELARGLVHRPCWGCHMIGTGFVGSHVDHWQTTKTLLALSRMEAGGAGIKWRIAQDSAHFLA